MGMMSSERLIFIIHIWRIDEEMDGESQNGIRGSFELVGRDGRVYFDSIEQVCELIIQTTKKTLLEPL
jgi:hypothetical protein